MQVKKKPKKTAKAVPEKSRKKKQPGEGQIKKQPFLKRMLFGEEKPDLSELEAGSTTILDILSPTTVDTKSRDYIIVDDVYHAYLYITGYGYTTTVGTCWLAPLVEAGEGINLSFLVKRQPKEKILSKIAQTTMVNRSRMRDVGDTRQDYEELDSAISSGLYLKDVMNRQGENFYYMHTLIEVTASDPETLEQRVTEVEKLCVSVDMIARRCDYKNEQAFLSALPILALDPDIERKARRNALTSGVAAAFPFVSYELSDHDGIFLGLNLYNRSPVFLNPYDDYKYTSGNWWIGGSTGAGKTVTLQCLGGRLREQGKRVIIIVPKKGHEFRPLCERLGGLYLRMSPSSKDCPNLMAIRRKSLDSYAKLKNIAARDDSVLADKIAQLIIWFSLKKKDLNEEDKSRLDSSLVEVYKRYGITFDNSTIVDENGNFRTMPILSDWYEILYQEQDTRHLAVVLSRYVTGSAAAMAGRNDIELNNKYIVLDLSGMPDDMIADGTFWATSIAYDLIMNCEDELSALLADELWSLVGATANPQAAGFVLEMVKTIRGLGGIAVTSTQGMQDLFSLEGGSYGKGILDSSRIKLVMQMEEQEARLIQDKLNLSEDEVRQITRFRRGEGLLCIGYRTEILTPQIATDKREDWVNKRVKSGLQVLITNPRCVETGLDLNAFTTIIFYSMGYNLFTLRQASRRSWRINQTAPRVEVYMLYYADTMQAKAMKLMASKLAVAGIIEGTFSEEGLAAMSDVKDLTSQMAKELALGIRDNVEDIAAAFRKMAVMNPERKKNIAAAQLKETAAEEQKAPAAKDSFGVRTAQAQVRQALYEGLLARTAEEQKKRKSKKAEVDENQLSIFGFAA